MSLKLSEQARSTFKYKFTFDSEDDEYRATYNETAGYIPDVDAFLPGYTETEAVGSGGGINLRYNEAIILSASDMSEEDNYYNADENGYYSRSYDKEEAYAEEAFTLINKIFKSIYQNGFVIPEVQKEADFNYLYEYLESNKDWKSFLENYFFDMIDDDKKHYDYGFENIGKLPEYDDFKNLLLVNSNKS